MAEDVVARYRLKFNDLASKGLLRVQGVARGMNRALTSASKGIGLVGIAAGAASIKLATMFADRADELNKFSREVDISAESLQRLEFVANRQGASFDKVKSGIQKFTKSMGEFRAGTGSLKTVLDRVDPALGKQLLAIEDNSEAMDFAVKALAKYTNTQKQAAVSAALFGRGGGSSFIRIVDGGAEALEQLNKEAAKFRPPIDAKSLALGEKFKDSLFNSQQVVASMGDRIGQKLLPPLTRLMDRFNDFIVANREVINSGIDRFFKRFGAFIQDIDFGEIVRRGKNFVSVIVDIGVKARDIIERLGGLKTVLIGLGAVFISAKVIAFASALASLVAIIGAPVLLAIGAVVAAGVLLYQNWDIIKAKAALMGIDIEAVFSSVAKAGRLFAGELASQIGGVISKAKAFVGAFQAASREIPLLMDRIKNEISLRVASIKAMITDLILLMARVASTLPAGRSIGAAVGAIQSRRGADAVASGGFGGGRDDVRVLVELDGQVRGADVKANVTTTSGRNRGGSNMPRGRVAGVGF